nr:retrovirus-related Pol polyprotein from transposon TNT 1-94 [Tanacetum cinerariifolium]
MEDTMLELVKICQEKDFLCIHDDIDDLIESALNSKLLLINLNSQRLDKKEHEVKNVVEQPSERENLAPILSTKEPKHLLRMRYEHLSITPQTKYDEVIESNTENLLTIPSECEVALEDKRRCDLPISENSPVCDIHSDTFSDSKIDDNISVYDDDFEDIEYVEASLSDLEIVSVEEENVVQQEEEEEEERLINLVKNDIFDDLSIDPLLKEVNLFLSDNLIPPGIENIADDPEGDIHFLEELLIDNSILSHESFDSNFEDSSISLTAFADADHAGCQDTRRSTSGSMQFLGDRLVRWSSKGQKKSCDIQSKHIDIEYYFIKEHVENGVIELYFVNTEYQLADIFTKALGRERIEFMINKLGM